MMKVLIVDDERLAVKYYTQLINWQFYGFEIIGTAYDGKEALRILEAKEPDIIITDIKMPVMDGIDLAKKARAINPDVHILFVTSYTDFNYTYNALKLGVDDYIMKDLVSAEVLLEKLHEIERKMNAKRNENSYTTERVIEELFTCGKIDSSKLEWLGERAQNVLNGKFYYLFVSQDSLVPVASAFFQDSASKHSRATAEACINFYNESFKPVSVFRHGDGVISVVKPTHAEINLTRCKALFLEYCKNLQAKLSGTLHQSFSVFTISKPQTLSAAGQLFADCEEGMSIKYFLECPLMIGLDAPQLTGGNLSDVFDVSLVENSLKNNDIMEIEHYLRGFFEKIKDARDLKTFYTAFYNCISLFKKYGNGLHGIQTGKEFKSDLCEQDKNMLYTIPDAMDWILEKFETLISIKSEGVSGKSSKETQEIIKYIMSNYSNQDLDVECISKGVAMSAARTEAKFKYETGLTLIDFLNKYRIQKATELLQSGDVKIYEISEKVGFASSQYFSKVFKKYTMLTPIEFKKRVTDETSEAPEKYYI